VVLFCLATPFSVRSFFLEKFDDTRQCCGSGSAWKKGRIRIRIKVISGVRNWIRCQAICWIRIRFNLQEKPKCMEYEHIWELFSRFWAFIGNLGSGSASASKWWAGSASGSASIVTGHLTKQEWAKLPFLSKQPNFLLSDYSISPRQSSSTWASA
jgi:hypothetical protein